MLPCLTALSRPRVARNENSKKSRRTFIGLFANSVAPCPDFSLISRNTTGDIGGPTDAKHQSQSLAEFADQRPQTFTAPSREYNSLPSHQRPSTFTAPPRE